LHKFRWLNGKKRYITGKTVGAHAPDFKTSLEVSAMKKLAFLAAILACFSIYPALADDQPRGSLMEVHSCELYAGGCVVSSEATLGGRYMLRAWNFTGGSFAGAELAGLQVALLESSSDNLAASKTAADHAIVYLPTIWPRAKQPPTTQSFIFRKARPLTSARRCWAG
jgi:hypothetical protein